MKNILLILPYGSVGGMERLALNFYNYYKSKGYNVKALKFFGLDSDIINFHEDEFVLSRKDLSEFRTLERIKFYLFAPFKIRRIIKKHQITHSISFGDLTNVFSALTFTKEFKIGSIHALKSIELSNNSWFSRLTKLSYRSTYKNFNKMVCISKAIKEDLIKKCDYKFQTHLEVIYNPHDLKKITELGSDPITDEYEKQIFEKDVILFLGRMSIQKSPWHLINAFNLLKQKDNINLVFIGDGDLEVTNYIKKLINQYHIDSQVYFLGRKSNPYKYLSKAKVLALSSHYEGTPNVIVEAMALNIPVVSSNCTAGIGELMSLNSIKISTNENLMVEGGVITPNLYFGKLGLPDSDGVSINKNELLFSNALEIILSNQKYYEIISKYSVELTKKFNLDYVCETYLI